ncbi:hypothetical protein FA592_09635 [Sulfurospirillum diekertiae]|uniref:Uncharacterized protein n=1 Tax=Sulfurospirillum diekertiae TaxID=1854492 RepID=A0A6G9VU92_9BACT|nr:hypothetical protein [Sulfurospirillum diekertiae]QIR76478.1 hypothetical protein FA584_09795 [Sulfurospirillum diekertiae]QIR79107.1 hypothetical protein FA592_09635 [Sulfurospirillum diekertiae]
MRLLLLNNNPAVSRLIKLSAEKAGYELDEFEDYGLVPLTTYDVILVDNELYDEASIVGACENTGCDYIIYICQRGAKKPDIAHVALEKPFLPTDFLVLLEKVKNVIISHKAEATEEATKVLQSLDESEKSAAFDIDQIDTLEDEDEDNTLPINLLEEPDDLEKEEDEKELTFDEIEAEDLGLEQELSLDDIVDKNDEDKELKIDDEFSFDELDSLEKEEVSSLEDFDFDEGNTTSLTPAETEDEREEEFANPSILDKDDINEVKQLLDESEEEAEEEEISELSLDAFDLDKENEEAGKFFFDDVEKEDESLEKDDMEKSLNLELDDVSSLDFEEVAPVGEEEKEDQSIEIPEEQEEIIDDFAEGIEEKIEEEEKELAQEEDILIPQVDVAFDALAQNGDIDSLDDLNENLLKKAFGEEVNEEESTPISVPEEKGEKIEVIRGEIESSIARSISGLAQSDILREALKGMRINISITFDEKE